MGLRFHPEKWSAPTRVLLAGGEEATLTDPQLVGLVQGEGASGRSDTSLSDYRVRSCELPDERVGQEIALPALHHQRRDSQRSSAKRPPVADRCR
jgi:hypothetical protein